MKQEFQPRPNSKSIMDNQANKTARGSMYVNTEQAQETFLKGKNEQQSNNLQKALELYIRSTIYDPSYYQAFCNMGSVYRSLGRYSQSRSSYLKAIQINPEDAISHYNLANVLRILGNIEESIKHYEYVINLKQQKNQNVSALYLNSLINIGICYKNRELYEKAIEYYEKATSIDKGDEAVMFNHAMTIVLIINRLDGDVFQEVRKERAGKAEALFKNLLGINPNNQLVQIQLIKIEAILYKSTENLNKAVSKLKALLPKSALKDQINETLGFVMKLLKEYQASAIYYQQSFKSGRELKKSQVSINIYDNQNSVANKNIDITQEQGLRLIQDEKVEEVVERVKKLKDEQLSKHVIQMAVQLFYSQSQGAESHFNNAVDIYNKYFFKNNQELQFSTLSIEAHKILGKFLSKQGKYKESIKHFEFISNKLKSNAQKSKIHSSLGSDYQALGDKQMALKEYKIALEQEPNNYEMMYNVGCCLSQAGNNQESLKYFNSFLEKIEKQPQLTMATKALYKADCLVTMSSCCYNMPNEYQIYEKAFKAIKEMQAESQDNNIQFEGDKLLNFYLRWADILQQKLSKITNKKSQEYLSCKEDILYSYINLLQNQMCPDRDAILNNCATIYYEEKLYMNCLSNLNQVASINAQTYNNLALTYLHLGEHYMATQAIYKAYGEDQNDSLIRWNKEIFDWIYGMGQSELINAKYPNKNEKAMIFRWQYGVILLDALTKKINQTEDNLSSEQVQAIIKKLLEKENLLSGLQQIQATKLKILLNIIQKPEPEESYFIQEPLLNLSLSKSNNLKNDLESIIKSNKSSKDRSILANQAILNLFIFHNPEKEPSIKNLLQPYVNKKEENIRLDLDRRVTIAPEKVSKTFTLANLSNLILNLCTWECQLQSNLVILVRIIEKCYYHYKHTKTLEIQHHFPRHSEYDECSATLDRLVRIIYTNFNIPHKFALKSKKITEMKGEILHQIQNSFDIFIRNEYQSTLSLNENLIPITIYGYFQSKSDCLAFIKELKKQSSSKIQVDIQKNTEEVNVVVSSLLKLTLIWSEEDHYKNSLISLVTSPIDLYHQSIIELSQGLQLIKEASQKSKESIQRIEALN